MSAVDDPVAAQLAREQRTIALLTPAEHAQIKAIMRRLRGEGIDVPAAVIQCAAVQEQAEYWMGLQKDGR